MRGISLGATTATVALLVATAPAAAARPQEISGEVTPSGAIAISWHGEPRRGCAQAGLCRYSGAVEVRPDGGQYDFTVNRHRVVDSYGFLDFFTTPVVRVKRAESGGAEAECVDGLSSDSAEVLATNGGRNRVRLGLYWDGLSSGRCAGPDMSGLLARLPRRTRSLSRLIANGGVLNLTGEVPFTAGRFSGTMRSTLRLHFRPGAPYVEISPPRRHPRHRRPLIRVVHLRASYRVSSLSGTLSASFVGLTEPPCEDLDACGVTGTSRWSLSATRGTLVVDADARARRSDRGVRGALAAVRRPGAYVFGEADLNRNFGTTSVDVSRSDGGTPCRDTGSGASPGLAAFNSGARRFTFELGGEDSFPTDDELLRAGCPGPRDDEMIGLAPLSTGSVPLTMLGRGAFSVDMRSSSRFTSNGYSGRRSSNFTAGLRLLSIRAVYKRARGIG